MSNVNNVKCQQCQMSTMSNVNNVKCQQCQIVKMSYCQQYQIVKLKLSKCQQCQIANNVKLSTMSKCQSNCQIVTTSNVMYYQSVWIRLAHRLYSDFQYFFLLLMFHISNISSSSGVFLKESKTVL